MSQEIRLQQIPSGHPTTTSITFIQTSHAATPSAQPRHSSHIQIVRCPRSICTKAAEIIGETISRYWSKLEELGKAVKRDFITKAAVEMRTCLTESWSKLKHGFSVIKQRFTLSIWLTIMISLVVGVVGLRYTDKATKLALWTATKDFYEHCQSQNVGFLLDMPNI